MDWKETPASSTFGSRRGERMGIAELAIGMGVLALMIGIAVAVVYAATRRRS